MMQCVQSLTKLLVIIWLVLMARGQKRNLLVTFHNRTTLTGEIDGREVQVNNAYPQGLLYEGKQCTGLAQTSTANAEIAHSLTFLLTHFKSGEKQTIFCTRTQFTTAGVTVQYCVFYMNFQYEVYIQDKKNHITPMDVDDPVGWYDILLKVICNSAGDIQISFQYVSRNEPLNLPKGNQKATNTQIDALIPPAEIVTGGDPQLNDMTGSVGCFYRPGNLTQHYFMGIVTRYEVDSAMPIQTGCLNPSYFYHPGCMVEQFVHIARLRASANTNLGTINGDVKSGYIPARPADTQLTFTAPQFYYRITPSSRSLLTLTRATGDGIHSEAFQFKGLQESFSILMYFDIAYYKKRTIGGAAIVNDLVTVLKLQRTSTGVDHVKISFTPSSNIVTVEFGSNTVTLTCSQDKIDDVAFMHALIDFTKVNLPIPGPYYKICLYNAHKHSSGTVYSECKNATALTNIWVPNSQYKIIHPPGRYAVEYIKIFDHPMTIKSIYHLFDFTLTQTGSVLYTRNGVSISLPTTCRYGGYSNLINYLDWEADLTYCPKNYHRQIDYCLPSADRPMKQVLRTDYNPSICVRVCKVGYQGTDLINCEQKCGDGLVSNSTEHECDDQNKNNGDGCSSTCQVEPKYNCTLRVYTGTTIPNISQWKSRCEKCGNGNRNTTMGETCDDGNTNLNDGCNNDCKVETGWTCPSNVCTEIHGDGLIVGSEVCDDKNLNNNDGCNANSQVESNWTCTYVTDRSRCSDKCGDGFNINQTNANWCDDGNKVSGDGCSSTCALESGWKCNIDANSKNICEEICQDGKRFNNLNTYCDTGGLTAGCNAKCEITVGYTCVGGSTTTKDVCTAVCGNGALAPGEPCDDGGKANGDGCSSTCNIETGWTCPNNVCTETHGDGIIVGTEVCDDKNFNAGDGCDLNSQIEQYYQCSYKVDRSVCSDLCGDSVNKNVLDNAYCDDGTASGNGDGCSTSCAVEAGWSCTNDAQAKSVCGEICMDGIKFNNNPTYCDTGTVKTGCNHLCQTQTGYQCQGGNSNTVDTCTSICGDGIRVTPEACDDGNKANNDGCKSTCDGIELGYECSTASPNVCKEKCGDGIRIIINAGECDTGTPQQPGCSSSCQVLTGWTCTGASSTTPDVCTPICGDGLRMVGEACDDKNQNSGDGCAADCKSVEAKWSCTGGSSTSKDVCKDLCGDGFNIDGGATYCDTGGVGLGCSTTCQVMTGFKCTGGNVNGADTCDEICGDGLRVGLEPCDDGNKKDGDGCDSQCKIETGYQCIGGSTTQKDTCTQICGDGRHMSNEKCDDQNILPDDGCTGTCQIEVGWSCTQGNINLRSECTEICGDGMRFNTNATYCDDHNNVNIDGCDKDCKIEYGFYCSKGGKTTKDECASQCGDGKKASDEECDDKNLDLGDGCELCKIVSGWKCFLDPGSGRSMCKPICGDGVLTKSHEECDDGNFIAGDGCDCQCKIEKGFVCATGGLCTPVIGDSFITPLEECDDANKVSKDGCSKDGKVEKDWLCQGTPSNCTQCHLKPYLCHPQEQVQQSSVSTTSKSISSVGVLSGATSGQMNPNVWALANTIQLVRIITLLNVQLPYNLKTYLNEGMEFFSFQCPWLKRKTNEMFQHMDFTTLRLSETKKSDKSAGDLDDKLNDYSIQSSVLIIQMINISYMIVLLGVAFTLLYIFSSICTRLLPKKGLCGEYFFRMAKNQLRYNVWIRCMNEFCLDLFIIGAINMRYPNSITISSHLAVSYITSIIFFGLTLIFVASVTITLYRKKLKDNRKKKEAKLQEIADQNDSDHNLASTQNLKQTQNEGGEAELVKAKQVPWDERFTEVYNSSNEKTHSVIIVCLQFFSRRLLLAINIALFKIISGRFQIYFLLVIQTTSVLLLCNPCFMIWKTKMFFLINFVLEMSILGIYAVVLQIDKETELKKKEQMGQYLVYAFTGVQGVVGILMVIDAYIELRSYCRKLKQRRLRKGLPDNSIKSKLFSKFRKNKIKSNPDPLPQDDFTTCSDFQITPVRQDIFKKIKKGNNPAYDLQPQGPQLSSPDSFIQIEQSQPKNLLLNEIADRKLKRKTGAFVGLDQSSRLMQFLDTNDGFGDVRTSQIKLQERL